MTGQSFRLEVPTLGILSIDGDVKRIPITLPLDAIVTVKNGPFNGTRLVDVLCEGKTVLMFTQDLRTRAVEFK